MSFTAVLAAALTTAFVAVAGAGPSAARRLRRLPSIDARAHPPAVLRARSGPPVVPARSGPPVLRHRLVAAAGGLGVAVAIGGPVGVVAGVGVAAAGCVVLARARVAPDIGRRRLIDATLPYAADLLAGCLVAGNPLVRAADAVGVAVGGPVGAALVASARAARLGAEPAGAFAAAFAEPGLEPLGRALTRALDTGAPLAATVSRVAVDVRAERAAAAETAAHRTAVLAVLPLGLCFLPGFLLLGVVPVAAGLAADVLGVLGV